MEGHLELGIEHMCVRHQIATLCPKLMAVLSLADNAGHGVYRKEAWMQELLSMHAKAVARDAKTDDAWNAIVKAQARGRQACAI